MDSVSRRAIYGLIPLCFFWPCHYRVAGAQGRGMKPAARTRPAARADTAVHSGGLAELVAAQQEAVNSGDAARTEAATRPLAAYLLREAAKLRVLQGKPEQAPELFRKALLLVDDPETHLELATSLMHTGQAPEAVREATAVAEAQPANVASLRVEASAYRAAGDDRSAIAAYQRVLAIEPDEHVAYALASTLLAVHEKEAAEKIFAQIFLTSANAAIWHVAAGDAYREALYFDDAVREFKKAIALDPRAGHAEFFLGFTYLQMNQWGPSSQSFEHLRAAVRQAPREYASNFYLGALESTDGSDIASSNRHLQTAAAADPLSPEVWLYLGLNAVREKQVEAAKGYLRKAIALTGEDERRNNYQIRRVYAILGRILIAEGNHVEGDALLAKYKQTEQRSLGNSASAIADAAAGETKTSPLSSVPAPAISFPAAKADAPDATYSLGERRSGPPMTAKRASELIATEKQLGSALASALNDLGTAEARQGNYAMAAAHFEEAERWCEPTAALLRNLGTAEFRVSNFERSAKALQAYLDLTGTGKGSAPGFGGDERARLMLAMSNFSLGQFAEADRSFEAVQTAAMADPRAAYSWAFSLARTGKQQQANSIADALIVQRLPSDILSLVCHLYMDTENFERSLACYQAAYRADPALPLAHYQAAESMIRLDRPADAVVELREELKLSPDNPDVQYALAFALLQSSGKDEAMRILQQVTETHPEQAQAQYQLGKILLEQGDTAGAIKHLEIAAEHDPDSDYTHYQLQAAYRKSGRTGDAEREARIYRDLKAQKRDSAGAKK